jgi:UDP-N-acetylmuramoyl-L-alanyl-D-glutamate--2,6-diaminopimelate ligase
MHTLKDLLYSCSLIQTGGNVDITISEIVFDSRKATDTTVFVAMQGTFSNGHDYIDQVLTKGCKAIVCEVWPSEIKEGVTYIQVNDSAKEIGRASCRERV